MYKYIYIYVAYCLLYICQPPSCIGSTTSWDALSISRASTRALKVMESATRPWNTSRPALLTIRRRRRRSDQTNTSCLSLYLRPFLQLLRRLMYHLLSIVSRMLRVRRWKDRKLKNVGSASYLFLS